MNVQRSGFDVLNTGYPGYDHEPKNSEESMYQHDVIVPLVSDIKLQLSLHKPQNPLTFLCGYWGNDELSLDMMVFDQCIYFASAVSAAMFVLWIGWMPLLHIISPDMQNVQHTPTTTISDTFSDHNVVATIYIVGPLSVLFLLRIYRTLRCAQLASSQQTKKFVCVLLIISQYSVFVVIRFDAIKGTAHAVATFLTFFLLLVYHYYTHKPNKSLRIVDGRFPLKFVLGFISTMCILCFAGLVSFVDEPLQHTGLWAIATLLEILGVLFLGALDMVDINELGSRLTVAYDMDSVCGSDDTQALGYSMHTNHALQYHKLTSTQNMLYANP